MISFLGFDANLDNILEKVENGLANNYLMTVCNKSFISLLKTKMRK